MKNRSLKSGGDKGEINNDANLKEIEKLKVENKKIRLDEKWLDDKAQTQAQLQVAIQVKTEKKTEYTEEDI